jgi:hypothetical protein
MEKLKEVEEVKAKVMVEAAEEEEVGQFSQLASTSAHPQCAPAALHRRTWAPVGQRTRCHCA